MVEQLDEIKEIIKGFDLKSVLSVDVSVFRNPSIHLDDLSELSKFKGFEIKTSYHVMLDFPLEHYINVGNIKIFTLSKRSETQ